MKLATTKIVVTASDLSGNIGNRIETSIVGPEQFGFPSPPIPYPNPARNYSRIRYSLTQPADTQVVNLKLYDVSGHKVRTLQQVAGSTVFTDNGNTFNWDLLDGRGRSVANGVYLFRIKATSSTGSSDSYKGKIAVIR